MDWINNLQSDPVSLLSYIIISVAVCIIIVVIILLHRLKNEKRITRAASELKKITNSIHAGLVHFILEDDCRILYASQGFFDILGYNKEEAKKLARGSLLDFIDQRDQSFIQEVNRQLKNNTIRCDVSFITKEKKVLHMLMNGNSSVGRDGRHTLSVVFIDISEQKRMQDMIILEGERYRIASELSNDVLFEYHIKTDQMLYSEKYRDIFGIEPIIEKFKSNYSKRGDRIHPDDWGIYLEFCDHISKGFDNLETEFRIKNRLGEFIWCQLMSKTIYDDKKHPLRVIGKLVNVDSQKKQLEVLEYKATRDPLTGVYNKEVTCKKIEKYISGNKNSKHALILIDFDDFKGINDQYGHLVGDKVLIYIVSLIKEAFVEGEIIGRIGGDEFVVFAGNIDNNYVKERASYLKQRLDTTYRCDNQIIPITSSIGIAIYPEAGMHYEQLMERADNALYSVKEQGKNNYMIYNSTI